MLLIGISIANTFYGIVNNPAVPSPLRYFLVPQYHKYRGSSAGYLSIVDTQ